MINHVGVKMKQPPATITAALKGGREAVSGSPRTPLLRQCLFFFFFFRLALKINARGGGETEKLIVVPLERLGESGAQVRTILQ